METEHNIPLCVVCRVREFDSEVSFNVPDTAGQETYIMVCKQCLQEKGYMNIIMEYGL